MLICYVFVRHLPATMNPGKAMAQVHHAGFQMARQWESADAKKTLKEYARGDGKGPDENFGTTIVLESVVKTNSLQQIEEILDKAGKLDYIHGHIEDPTYPIDHEVTMPLVTVGYVLADKDQFEKDFPEVKKNWKLHA